MKPTTQLVEKIARVIDSNAFDEDSPAKTRQQRQQLALQKANTIAQEFLAPTVDELSEADQQLHDMGQLAAQVNASFKIRLAPAAARRRALLIQYGVLEDKNVDDHG